MPLSSDNDFTENVRTSPLGARDISGRTVCEPTIALEKYSELVAHFPVFVP